MVKMEFKDLSCIEFCNELDSKESVPGGGGASALAGGLGAALAGMVCSLTVGKKKYAAYEPEIYEIWKKASSIKERLLQAIDRDAASFKPLAEAYGIPKTDPKRDVIMETALHSASTVPLEIMLLAAETIDLLAVLAEKGSILAISDVGVGAAMSRAALTGASLNIYINTKAMKDRASAEKINAEANDLMEKYIPLADEIFNKVLLKLR